MRAEDYIGRSRELVEEFIVEEVNPVLEPYLNQKNQPDVAVSFIDTLVEEKYSSRVDFQETVKLTI